MSRREVPMRALCLAFLGCLVLVAVAPAVRAADEQELILGTWEPADEKEKGNTVEFAKGGTAKFTMKKGETVTNFDAQYKILPDKNLEFTMKDPLDASR